MVTQNRFRTKRKGTFQTVLVPRLSHNRESISPEEERISFVASEWMKEMMMKVTAPGTSVSFASVVQDRNIIKR